MPASLQTLEILAVDCQATAAHPRGDLLEVGWARASAARAPAEIESYVVAPRGPFRLSRRLRGLTGLTGRALRNGISRDQLRARLASVVSRAACRPAPVVCVAHFARFEAPFLRDLLSPETIELVCTHEIARRVLPDLPRRGLRAVAGYLGHGTPETRRAGAHVAATLHVWRGLVSLLDEEHGIRDLDALRAWLGSRSPGRRGRVYPMEARTRLDLPDAPGVYRFQRSDRSVVYIGKATSLRQRVNTYFQTARGHGDRTLEMLAQARAVDVTPTPSALEAALLEPDEIKRLRPPYNVALREKGRRLAYWSWSLREAAPHPDERHPVGPFLSQGPRPPVSALLQLLDGGGEARAVERMAPSVLGLPRRYAPDSRAFRAGLDLFVARHGHWWAHGSPARSLTSLASRLGRPPETDPSSGEEKIENRWTANRVADALDDVVRRGAHVLRRARWLVALSECSLAWEEGGGPVRRGLVVGGGAVVSRHVLSSLAEVPAPPGHDLPLLERQERLDLAAYDRLSVLSRELKGLVAGGRPIVLRLGPQARLQGHRLGHALRSV